MRAIDADALIHELNNSHFPGAPYVDAGISIAIEKVRDAPTIEPKIVLCKDCIFGHLYFDVHIGAYTDSWVECLNPDGLNRDVSCEGYCSAGIRRKDNG